jgi:putative DNA primase/helicase
MLERDGDGYASRAIIGACGIYQGDDNGKIKLELRVEGNGAKLDQQQRDAIAAKLRDDQKRLKAMRKAEATRARQRAASAWRQLTECTKHDYLTRKGVNAYGVRLSPSGAMAIPMADAAGTVHGLQIIRGKDRPADKLEKEYWPRGIDKAGHYHMIGVAGPVILITEGYATGATLHEATGYPVAVAFDANNLLPVAQAIKSAYSRSNLLICGDDDYLWKCHVKDETGHKCGTFNLQTSNICRQCGTENTSHRNAGEIGADAAAMAVSGSYLLPKFGERPSDRKGPNDFNDLAAIDGMQAVRGQVDSHLAGLGWRATAIPTAAIANKGAGEGEKRPPAQSVMALDDVVDRFIPIDDGTGKTAADTWTRNLVHKEQISAILPAGVRWDDVKRHPIWVTRGSYYADQVDFDASESDPKVKFNLFGGWPTLPKKGICTALLELLEYMCSNDSNGLAVYQYVLRWLAYPIQHPGAKMHVAIIVHGPQGVGKSRFFEAIVDIYGQYGTVLSQDAVEDKFNSDWATKKLFIVADEVVARSEMYHVKNKLKGIVTGRTIRVNPKNLAAHTERNQINMVFLSNEKKPLALEEDDRRHCVIWVPPKLPAGVYDAVTDEISNGGIEALHWHLKHEVDLTDFSPYSAPPMTTAKQDLIDIGRGSVDQFLREWINLEVVGKDGEVLPLCPCTGSALYQAYKLYCQSTGERDRGQREMASILRKMDGWSVNNSEATYDKIGSKERKNRKMIIPPTKVMTDATRIDPTNMQIEVMKREGETKQEWLTRCHFAFNTALGEGTSP